MYAVFVSIFLGLAAVQPALAGPWDVHIGVLTAGSYGDMGAMTYQTLITTDGEKGVCDSINNRLLRNNKNGWGPGNFACDGCYRGDDQWEWDFDWITLTAEDLPDDKNPIQIKKLGSDKLKDYEVLDWNGNLGGTCVRLRGKEKTGCDVGLDAYSTVHVLDCNLAWPT